jgi:hypothetical protein
MRTRYFFGSLLVFYFFAALAMLLNELIYKFVLFDRPSEAINLFYISRHYNSTLPLLADVYKAVPYGAYLAVCVFFSTIFQASSAVLDTNGLPKEDAAALQAIADKIALRSFI